LNMQMEHIVTMFKYVMGDHLLRIDILTLPKDLILVVYIQ